MVKKFWRYLEKGYVALIFLFLYAPILFLMVFSFNNGRTMGSWQGFTLKWYQELFADKAILNALWNTVTVALLAAVVATVLGTLAAIGIHNFKGRRKQVVLQCSYLPIVNPDIVTGVSLMLLFVFLGIPRGYWTMVLAHITFNVPFVLFSVLPKLDQMPDHLYEAALDLGATPGRAMLRVVLPQIMPGIVTGFLFAVTLSLDDFVITFFTTQGVSNLSMMVYSMAKRGISPKINALSTLMFVVIVGMLFCINLRVLKGRKKG